MIIKEEDATEKMEVEATEVKAPAEKDSPEIGRASCRERV